MRLLAEESDASDQSSDLEIALSKAVDVMEQSLETNAESSNSKKEKQREYEQECREKLSTEAQSNPKATKEPLEIVRGNEGNLLSADNVSQQSVDNVSWQSDSKVDEKPVEEERMLSYHRKVTVLYELLSACLADQQEKNKKCTRRRKGYDARHRVTLRLLSTWLDIKWTKMVRMCYMIPFFKLTCQWKICMLFLA